MRPEIPHNDLVTFSKIGNALWVDSAYSERSSIETLAATALLDLTPERLLEKATRALLERARQGGPAANTQLNSAVIFQKFFRLSLEQRFVLVALHVGRWSYSRLERVLAISSEQLQELAWTARLQLSTLPSYPSGPATQGPTCPEYDQRKPWTQRFLDEEVSSKRDQFYLQGHLLSCPSCSQALARSRDLYFNVDQEISKWTQEGDDFADSLARVLSQSSQQKYPSDRTFRESLEVFTERQDVRVVLGAVLSLLVIKVFRIFL